MHLSYLMIIGSGFPIGRGQCLPVKRTLIVTKLYSVLILCSRYQAFPILAETELRCPAINVGVNPSPLLPSVNATLD